VAPLVLVAPVSAPGADARAFLDAARQAGNSWSYGSPGVGTVGHLGMELLKARTGIAPVHVPYPGYPRCSAAWCAASAAVRCRRRAGPDQIAAASCAASA
jgi:tripartite-type tricarboxylate transporter receptor subunit TctC